MNKKFENYHLELLDKYGLLDHQDVCEIKSFKSGETIFSQGTEYKYIMIVVSGKAKVCTSAPSGKDLVLAYYLSSGLIGDVELMSNTSYATASVITLSPFECIVVPFINDHDSIFKNITFMTTLAKGLSENLINSSHNYTSNALYSGEQRLCAYILQGSYKDYFFDNLTDVAATIGISYRHLLRLLNKLCEDNVLKREKRKFLILNKDQLKKRSSEAEYFKKNI